MDYDQLAQETAFITGNHISVYSKIYTGFILCQNSCRIMDSGYLKWYTYNYLLFISKCHADL